MARSQHPQPDLFAAPDDGRAAATRSRAVEPAEHSPRLGELAAQLPRLLRLGTSSWSFPGWRGLVYAGPEHRPTALAKQGLAAYARHPLLRAVGIDRGYYAPVPEQVLARYAAEVPRSFRFLLKAHAALTTPPSGTRPPFLQGAPDLFLDVAHARGAVLEPARRALGETLGVLLFQFPPLPPSVWRRRDELLARVYDFLRALPPDVPYALEWRNREILGGDYHAMLAAAGAVHAPCSHPRMPPVDEQGVDVTAAPLVAIRWLLGHGRGYEEARAAYAPFDRIVEPDEPARERIATLVARAIQSGRDALVIVNNKAEGSAPLSIAALAQRLTLDTAASSPG